MSRKFTEPPEQLMTEQEAAEMLSRSVKTLRNDRSLGRGPKWVKLGRSVRYKLSDVLAYVNSRAGGGALVLFWLTDYLDWLDCI